MRGLGTLVVFLALAGGLFWAYSSGWIDSFAYKTDTGIVGGHQTFKLPNNEVLHVFDLVTDEGVHINVGFDYDNFSLTDGLRARVTFVAKSTYSNGEKDSSNQNARVEWHRIVEYQILVNKENK